MTVEALNTPGCGAANSAGGLGTGNGLAGAILALALGLIGLVLGGLAVAPDGTVLMGGSFGGDLTTPAGGAHTDILSGYLVRLAAF